MNNDLLFDFNVDKTAKTVYISREFNATQSLVWDAFTKAELLDQWGAPAPMHVCYGDVDHLIPGQTDQAIS